jgi:hypothetical protein
MPLTLIKRAAAAEIFLRRSKGKTQSHDASFCAETVSFGFRARLLEGAKAGQRQIRLQEFFVTVDREVTTGASVTTPSKSKHLIFSLN